MESPFKNVDSAVPNPDFDILRDMFEEVDPRAYFEFLHCVPESDRNREGLIDYLQAHEPMMFLCFENITECYQNAFFNAVRSRDALLKGYVAYRVARDSLEDATKEKMEATLTKQIETKTPAKGKRGREKKTTEESAAKDMETTKRVRAMVAPADNFYAQERFSKDFPFAQFAHVAKKNKQKYDLKLLQESDGWETLYHVNGMWQAEQLVQCLKLQGKKCIIIKRLRGGQDQEVMSYKVIASK